MTLVIYISMLFGRWMYKWIDFNRWESVYEGLLVIKGKYSLEDNVFNGMKLMFKL